MMFEKITAIALDVDGVLTDGTVWWGPNGEELKRFCYADITGIPRAMAAGLKIALISGESSASSMDLVQRFADKLSIKDVYKACRDKASAVRDFATKHDVPLSHVCFIGDDIQDVPALSIVGVAAVPANAQDAAKAAARFISRREGGFGAVREVLDQILLNGRSVPPSGRSSENIHEATS